MLKSLNRSLAVFAVGLLATSLTFASESPNKAKNKHKTRTQAPVEIRIVPVGPTQEQIENIKSIVARSGAVQKELGGTNHRLVAFEYVDRDDKQTVGKFEPTQFRATFYDYTNDRTVIASGELATPENLILAEDAGKPNPDESELVDAADIVARDARFASFIKEQKLRTFPAMPPLTITDSGERLINIGLESLDSATRNEVVSVSLKRGEVIRYESAAPPISAAEPDNCGIASGSGGSTSNGTAGQYQMTVTQNGAPLWEYLVIRPSASSGSPSERSGIELRDLRYKGKMVMKRAHAPVLNVEYVNNACGPYRDWQYQEGAFNAPDTGAQNPAPGIRLLAEGQIATTALDTGIDTGNFRGVAVYRQNNETVMVSEMNAGWYRYIMEWRLADDGTIKPRYGYGATKNSCVCLVHTHHTYWRFDFDIAGEAKNNIYLAEKPTRSPIQTKGTVPKSLTQINTEAMYLRNYARFRSMIVENPTTREAYMFQPNRTDGVNDTYGGGDIWVLRYRDNGGQPGELDDPNTSTAINLNPWLNNESVANEDLVIWYGAHYIHSDGQNLLDPDRSAQVLSGSHVVGPEIVPIRW